MDEMYLQKFFLVSKSKGGGDIPHFRLVTTCFLKVKVAGNSLNFVVLFTFTTPLILVGTNSVAHKLGEI
jgi:hypothetical protein